MLAPTVSIARALLCTLSESLSAFCPTWATSLTIIGIPFYLIDRAIIWGINSGEEMLIKEEGTKVLAAYKKAIADCDNEKVKEELQKKYDALSKKFENLNKKD